jgi:TatD DNase family protein
MVYTDSHAHLSDVAEGQPEAFAALMTTYAKAWDVSPEPSDGEVSASTRGLIVDVGVEADDFSGRLANIGRHPFLRYSLGVWPGKEALEDPAASLATLAHSLEVAGPDAAALGECGLDYHHEEGSHQAQAKLFEGQISLAVQHRLPLIVHSREAFADTRDILASAGSSIPVIIHCFGYGPAEVEDFLASGYFVSFAGNLTYKKSEALREALALMPAERLLLETDSPYMNPEPRRGKPGSPLDIGRTYEFAARLRGESPEFLAATVLSNAMRLFCKGL